MKRSPIGFFNGTYHKKEIDLFQGVMYEERIFISPKEFEEMAKNENGECLIMHEGKERKGEIICQSCFCNKYIIGLKKE
jgi:hypothetical protein